MNSLREELTEFRKNLSVAWINSASRSDIETKLLELKTAHDLYVSKYAEVDTSQLTSMNVEALKNHKYVADQAFNQSKQLLETSKFIIADKNKKFLDQLFDKLKAERAGITIDYLHGATIEQLQAKRSQHSAILNQFISKFNEVKQSTTFNNLSKEDQDTLASHRLYVDTASKNVDGYLVGEINKKQKAEQVGDSQLETLEQLKKEFNLVSKADLDKANQQLAEATEKSKKADELANQLASEKEKRKLADERAQQLTNEKNEKSKAAEELSQELAREKEKSKNASELEGQLEAEKEKAKNADELAKQLASERERSKTVDQLTRQLADEREKAKSLEQKLENRQSANQGAATQYEDEYPDQIYVDYDQMVAEPAGQIQEQGITTLKIGSVQLPTFNGELDDWEAFRDMFIHLVDNSKKLSKTIKFHELRTHLKGPALETIKGYQVAGVNYEAAWSDLKKRYDRTSELIDDYIRKFFESKAIEHKAHFMNIRAIIDATNQMLRALPGLGVNVENWDPIIQLIICSKLNDELRSEWRTKVTEENKKGVKSLLEYLEKRAIELQPSQGDRLSKMLKGDTCRKPPRKVFQTNKKECLVCKGNHSVWDCYMLKKECAKARSNIIKTLGLCFKCLLKHRADMCDEDDCEYCGGPHNIMLCYKKENSENQQKAITNGGKLGKGLQKPKNKNGGPKSKQQGRRNDPKPSTSQQDAGDWDNEDFPNKPSKNLKN